VRNIFSRVPVALFHPSTIDPCNIPDLLRLLWAEPQGANFPVEVEEEEDHQSLEEEVAAAEAVEVQAYCCQLGVS
jgi:hypothetical protein